MSKPNLVWNVYRNDFNSKEIKVFNVFNHYRFREDVEKLIKSKPSYDELSEQLRKTAMYYFWSKCEHEVVVTSFPPRIGASEIQRIRNDSYPYGTSVNLKTGSKVDVYNQLQLNWDQFVGYVWRVYA